MRLRRRRPTNPPTRSLIGHPIAEPHPWGENRTWCSRCGRAAYVDDLAFHVWHVGGENGRMSSANGSCTLTICAPAQEQAKPPRGRIWEPKVSSGSENDQQVTS